jgi:hypothetical protein
MKTVTMQEYVDLDWRRTYDNPRARMLQSIVNEFHQNNAADVVEIEQEDVEGFFDLENTRSRNLLCSALRSVLARSDNKKKGIKVSSRGGRVFLLYCK